MFCEGCGAGNHTTSRFCYHCGRPLPATPATAEGRVVPPGTVFCGECGTANPDIHQFCSGCGRPIGRLPVRGPEKPAAEPPRVQAQPAREDLPAAAVQSPFGKALLYASITAGLVSFFLLPYVLSVAAIILGAVTMANKNRLGAIGIVIGIIAILVDYSYINFLTFHAP
jgi:hypothetical protein